MIYLIGFSGAGKTTIGKHLALQKNRKFIDTDEQIEKEHKKSISNIFKEYGENYFRKLERDMLRKVDGSIISCGGGLPIYNHNMQYIKESGISIYIKASEKKIFERLSKIKHTRPLIQKKSDKGLKIFIKEELKNRREIYEMADYTINTDHKLTEEILRQINSLPFTL